MKKKIIIAALVLLGAALPVAGLASGVAAQNMKAGMNVTVAADETVEKTLFTSGQTVKVAGTVDGDVFCAGQSVVITGTVLGDVICAGQNVEITGTVEGDVRAAGQTVTLGGEVQGNATIGAQTFTLKEDALVNDIAVGATVATLNGEVQRDAYLGSENATFNGLVGRNANVDAMQVNLEDNARIAGDLSYPEQAELARAEGAEVIGQTEQYESATTTSSSGPNAAQIIGGIIFILLLLLTASMGLVALMPRLFQAVSQHVVDKPGKTVLIGLAAVFGIPILAIALMISLIGVLLGVMLLVAYALMLFLSGPVAGYFVGRLLLSDRSTNPLLYMLIGSVLLITAYLIPFLGGLIMFAAAVLGSGMIVRELFIRGKDISYDVAPKKPKAASAKK